MMKAFSIRALHKASATGRFLRDKRGIAALEFALVVPLMLAMYLGTIEISSAVSINRKISRVASTIADLVTQQDQVDKNKLDNILEIGEAVLFPYDTRKPDIWITAIDVDSSYPEGGKVAWSRRYNKGTFQTGATVNDDTFVPTDLRIDGTFLVRVDAKIDYVPIVGWVIGDTIGTVDNGVGVLGMSERYFLRPRLGEDIPCTDC
jgi:Flp pilus assembly protein TadG